MRKRGGADSATGAPAALQNRSRSQTIAIPREQTRLLHVRQVEHLLGHPLPGQRPQALAGATCHDDDVSHDVTLASPHFARRRGEPSRGHLC